MAAKTLLFSSLASDACCKMQQASPFNQLIIKPLGATPPERNEGSGLEPFI
jgi:hypothetical protein